MAEFVIWLGDSGSRIVSCAGGKGASLSEMTRSLLNAGINIPSGFVITSKAFSAFIAPIKPKLSLILSSLKKDYSNLNVVSRDVRKIIESTQLPKEIESKIKASSRGMKSVAVRSSATAEDLSDASFAGMYDTYLNVCGDAAIINACKRCFSSLYTERAIRYRVQNGFSHNVSMAVVIQEMIESDVSGVALTADSESGFRDAVIIESSWGLGESIVGGRIEPDEFEVFKPKLSEFKPIINKRLGSKSIKTVFGRTGTKTLRSSKKEITSFSLSEEQILEIAKSATKIEEHYGKPMDIEWAIKSGKLFILQARPITTLKSYKVEKTRYVLKSVGKILTEGLAIGGKIASGRVSLIKTERDFLKFKEGDVLVAEMTNPDWMHVMMKASAIVTDKGGRTSHSAIVSRELGIPCIVGTRDATKKLKGVVTVCCSEGERGKVYAGGLKFERIKEHQKEVTTCTEVLMNINFSDMAFFYQAYPSNGVGMVREEMLIMEKVGVHPLALLNYKKLKKAGKERELIQTIVEKTKGYDSPKEYYVERLALALGKIAAAFYPRQVIVKLNDFKSNEYKKIPGGNIYEPDENNPTLGWRSARYYSKEYKPAFLLECKALKKVREEMGLDNIHAMVPYCRTPEEGRAILDTIAESGLRHESGFRIIAEVEVPVSIILMDDYAQLFDGFQIGSNCLTQSILCLDKDNPLTNHLFNERHPAMKKIISEAIQKAHKNGRKIGIVGQAPSDYPDFTEFLVREGIDSISLNPDPETFIRLRERIADVEKRC